MGPAGKNVLLVKRGPDRITNDGVTVARSIVLRDEIENLGAQAARESAIKTSEMVGDGTTTSSVLALAILDKFMGDVDDKVLGAVGQRNMMEIKREIMEAYKQVVEELKKIAKPISTRQDLEAVATVALENETLGKIVAEIVETVGINGFVSVDEGFREETEYEIIQGMQFDGTYIADELVNTTWREVRYEDTPIIVYGGEIESYYVLNDLVKYVIEHLKKGKLFIIAEKFSKDIIQFFVGTTKTGKFQLLGIKAPSLTPEQLEDIAVYTGGVFFNIAKGDKVSFEKLGPDCFGNAKKLTADRDKVIIIGGRGDQEIIDKRIEMLKEHEKIEKALPLKKKVARRIASLSKGVGVIRIGAPTDIEKHYLRWKVENAIHSSQAAMEEGIVPGGGLALKQIAETMPENILSDILKAPYELIQKNAGGSLEIRDNVFDPVKITRVALQNAVSLAANLITCGMGIAWHEHDMESFLQDIMDDYSLRQSHNFTDGGERLGMP